MGNYIAREDAFQLLKKYKSSNFAAGCSREVIQRGADMLGWELNTLIEKTIYAMRSCEKEIQVAMEQQK